jgi:large subunit ribosomal protein L24
VEQPMARQFDPKHTFKSKLRKGDEVIVLSGKSKGQTATIERLDKKHGYVYLAGKHLGKKHQKPDLQNSEGGIVEIPMPLHISSVAFADGKKASRLGFKVDGKKKVRVARKSGSEVAAK